MDVEGKHVVPFLDGYAPQSTPDGMWILFYTGSYTRLRRIDSPTIVWEIPHITGSTISPDGDEVFNLDSGYTFYNTHNPSQKRQYLNQFVAGYAPAWSPNGEWISLGENRLILRISANFQNGEEVGVLARQIGEDVGSQAWSPDSQWIVYLNRTRLRDRCSIVKLNVSTREQYILSRGWNYCSDVAWSPDGDYLAFSAGHTGHYGIFKMDANGKQLQNISPQNVSLGEPQLMWIPSIDLDWQPYKLVITASLMLIFGVLLYFGNRVERRMFNEVFNLRA